MYTHGHFKQKLDHKIFKEGTWSYHPYCLACY